MAKVPAFAKVIAGRWRIVEMYNWDNVRGDKQDGTRASSVSDCRAATRGQNLLWEPASRLVLTLSAIL